MRDASGTGWPSFRTSGLDPGPAEVSCRIVSEESWEHAWKKYYKPVRVTERLIVCPVWEKADPGQGGTVIRLDPGMAFGTGTHATTQMCLRLLEKHLRPGDRVIDVGCGSGILSIAAAKLGAGSVLAVDLDEVAVRKTRENAGLNGVQDRVSVRTGDLLEGVTEEADLILANLLAPIILRLARDLCRVLRPGGRPDRLGNRFRPDSKRSRSPGGCGFGDGGNDWRRGLGGAGGKR